MKKIYSIIVVLFLLLIIEFLFLLNLIYKFKEEKTISLPINVENKIERTEELTISRNNNITKAVSDVEYAVVSVNVIKTQYVKKRYSNPLYNSFFGLFDPIYKENVKSIGTGVILGKNGYIITNYHVVEGATVIKVVLNDGRSSSAKVIGFDQVQDIAVLKIELDNLLVAKIGDSSNILIGEWCVAIGNPYGFVLKDSKPSVSVGVISAVGRNFKENQNGKIYKKMIQTDAAINPGNSGGPLVNILGEVIGINSFILSESGGSNGIGFAIPINRVKKAFDEILKYGKVRDIWFGFKVRDITPQIAYHIGLKSLDGVIVTSVENRGPASKIGIKKGDVIIEINNTKIKDSEDAELAVSDVSVGDKIKIVLESGKKKRTVFLSALEYK